MNLLSRPGRTEASSFKTRKLFSRSAVVLGRPHRTEAPSLNTRTSSVGTRPSPAAPSIRSPIRYLNGKEEQILIQRRIDVYLDQGYGSSYLKDPALAAMVEESLLDRDGIDYKLSAWVVMPNHTHSLLRRFEGKKIKDIMDAHKGYTAHKANEYLNRSGEFWMKEYFDRFIRNEEHYWNTVRYIENNPVKARLCKEPSDWPFSSAWFRKHGRKKN